MITNPSDNTYRTREKQQRSFWLFKIRNLAPSIKVDIILGNHLGMYSCGFTIEFSFMLDAMDMDWIRWIDTVPCLPIQYIHIESYRKVDGGYFRSFHANHIKTSITKVLDRLFAAWALWTIGHSIKNAVVVDLEIVERCSNLGSFTAGLITPWWIGSSWLRL